MIPERFQPLVEATAELAKRFDAAGRSIFLVGGSVRDAFLAGPAPGRGVGEGAHVVDAPDLPDIDLTTDALPDEIERIVTGWADGVWLQGKRFGTVGAARRAADRDHHPPGRGLRPRLAQARGRLR